MHRIYVTPQDITAERIIVNNKDDAHHLRDVLQLRAGEKVAAFDGKGNEYACVIEGAGDKVILGIKKRNSLHKKKEAFTITVACAIPKNSRFDDIVDKLTQLGADKIIPLAAERGVVKIAKEKEAARLERWRKIARSASCQSQRNTIPVVESLKDVKEVLAQAKEYDLKLIPTLPGKRKALKDIFARARPKNILIFIGPEGDFSQREIEAALKAGCIAVSLGDTVLRVETAAVAAASYIRMTF